MKMLQQGDVNRRERWVLDSAWRCSTCHALVQIEPGDFVEGSHMDEFYGDPPTPARVKLHDSQMDGEFFTTTCPYCGKPMSGSKGQGEPFPEHPVFDVRETTIENPTLLGYERHPRGWGKGINQR
jgi:hypothetical protein